MKIKNRKWSAHVLEVVCVLYARARVCGAKLLISQILASLEVFISSSNVICFSLALHLPLSANTFPWDGRSRFGRVSRWPFVVVTLTRCHSIARYFRMTISKIIRGQFIGLVFKLLCYSQIYQYLY